MCAHWRGQARWESSCRISPRATCSGAVSYTHLTPTILPYARDYARYILFGAPVMCASFVLNNILRGEGKAMLAMVGIGLGGVLNIGLDPLFIY